MPKVIQLRDIINRQFEFLCIDTGRGVVYAEYSVDIYGESLFKTDIDRLLYLIANNSNLLNMPERQKDFWPYRKKTLSPDHLIQLNRWRKILGLREV